MKTEIYYFSGTGNTYVSAFSLKDKLNNTEIFPITLSINTINTERLIIICPTYAYGVPNLVKKFLVNTTIIAQEIIFLATYATKTGSIFYQVKKILKKKKLTINYHNKIKTVENFFAIFKRQTDIEEKEIIINQYKNIDLIYKDIINNKSNKIKCKLFTRIITNLYYLFRVQINKRIKISNKCISCGICIKVCPSNAIKIENNKAIINYKICQTCQACINYCPSNAITFLRIKEDFKKYHHPDAGYKNKEY